MRLTYHATTRLHRVVYNGLDPIEVKAALKAMPAVSSKTYIPLGGESFKGCRIYAVADGSNVVTITPLSARQEALYIQ